MLQAVPSEPCPAWALLATRVPRQGAGRAAQPGARAAQVRPVGFSFQTGLSAGNDTSFLLTF